MTRKINIDALNHAIKLYLSGNSVKQCSEITGITEAALYARFWKIGITTNKISEYRKKRDDACSKAIDLISKGWDTIDAINQFRITRNVFYRYAKKIGFKIPSKHQKTISKIDVSLIIPMFENGVGVTGIAEKLGVSPRPIQKFLTDKGIKLRDRSEQQFARMANSTPEQIAELTKNAHKAARGRKASKEEMIRAAKSKEGRPDTRSLYDRAIYNILSSNGFPEAIPSKAIDIYNADICIGSITVEIFGGGWSFSDRRRVSRYISRCKKIAEFGFHTIFFIVLNERWIGDCGELIKTINVARSLPSSPSKYWVVWGNRESSSGFCSNLDDSAFIMPFVNIRNPATGQYVSIPR